MPLPLKYHIAARYIRSPKSHSVINLISGVSIVAMAVPVAAVILLLSIFNGLETMTRELYSAVDADLMITPSQGVTFDIASLDAELLRQNEQVEAFSFVLHHTAIAESGEDRTFAEVKGVDSAYLAVVPIEHTLLTGAFEIEGDDGPHLIAAHGVMQDLDLMQSSSIGTPLRLYAINRARFSSLMPIGGYTRREMPVVGIYSIDEDHRSMILTSLAAAQDLFNLDGRASAVEIALQGYADASAVKQSLAELLGEDFVVRTRDESNTIYRLMALEKWGVFFISILVMLVASLSIVGTLVMVIIDKRDDMQTLRTMGAKEELVRGIFISEGRLLSLVSLVLGVVLGVVLTLLQQWFGFVGIDAPSLSVSDYPVELHIGDVLLTMAAYILIAYVVVWLTVRAVMKYNTTR